MERQCLWTRFFFHGGTLCFHNMPTSGRTTSANGYRWLHSKTGLESSARCLQTLRCWCVCRGRTCSSLILFHMLRICCHTQPSSHTLKCAHTHTQTHTLFTPPPLPSDFLCHLFIPDVRSQRRDIVHTENATEICITRVVNYVPGCVFQFWGCGREYDFFFFLPERRRVPTNDFVGGSIKVGRRRAEGHVCHVAAGSSSHPFPDHGEIYFLSPGSWDPSCLFWSDWSSLSGEEKGRFAHSSLKKSMRPVSVWHLILTRLKLTARRRRLIITHSFWGASHHLCSSRCSTCTQLKNWQDPKVWSWNSYKSLIVCSFFSLPSYI